MSITVRSFVLADRQGTETIDMPKTPVKLPAFFGDAAVPGDAHGSSLGDALTLSLTCLEERFAFPFP
jgi:hypothetical protein